MKEAVGKKQAASWFPAQFLCPKLAQDIGEPASDFAFLILNQPILNKGYFLTLWRNASFRICADGGSNRLYDALEEGERGRQDYLPDCIAGDLDSIRPNVEAFYKSCNVTVHMGDDQESTDFGKCLEYIERKFNSTSESLMSVVVYGSLGGRVDQALHSIHQLYVTAQSNSQRKLYLTSEESMSFALEKGENIIHVPRAIFGITCGIIPVGGRSVISTLGLEWDVADWETSFGGRMSTSNHLKADTVVINTEEVVVFTVEVSADRLMSVDRLVSVAGALLEES